MAFMDRDDEDVLSPKFDKKFWFFCFAVIAVFFVWSVLKPRKPVAQNIPAEAFVLPEGCNPNAPIFESGFRPKSPCFSERYRIKDPEKYNFERANGSRFLDRRYYRFYDKVVHLVCDSPYDSCQVYNVNEGVFVDKSGAVK